MASVRAVAGRIGRNRHAGSPVAVASTTNAGPLQGFRSKAVRAKAAGLEISALADPLFRASAGRSGRFDTAPAPHPSVHLQTASVAVPAATVVSLGTPRLSGQRVRAASPPRPVHRGGLGTVMMLSKCSRSQTRSGDQAIRAKARRRCWNRRSSMTTCAAHRWNAGGAHLGPQAGSGPGAVAVPSSRATYAGEIPVLA